jgi:MFS family permease
VQHSKNVTARSAISAFIALEHLLGTPAEPLAWQWYTDMVTGLRRSYVAFMVQQAVLTGAVAGLGAAIIASLWEDNRLFALILLGAALLFAIGWSQMLGSTVAPLLRRSRHVWPQRLFVVLYEVGVLSGFVVPPSLPWSVVVGCVVAAPWLASGLLERRQPVPTAALLDVTHR